MAVIFGKYVEFIWQAILVFSAINNVQHILIVEMAK